MKFIVLDNDGIGPEIMEATLPVLKKLDERLGLNIELEHMVTGMRALKAEGETIPQRVYDACAAADGVILGPVSSYEYPSEAEGGMNPSKAFRKTYDLFANIRPAKTRPGVPSVIKQMDLVIVRENTEGLYADRNMFMGSGEFMPTEDVALSVRKITRQGCERIARQAFEMAMERRKKVTAVHKANVLKMTDGLFLNTVMEVAKDYPAVEVEELIIDAATAHLVKRPQDFDVIVTTNAFGDILSDLCSELSGSLGLAGSINAGKEHVFAQAQHGSAPDIAGKGIANPTALMLSTAMLIEELGRRTSRNDLAEAAASMFKAIELTLNDPASHTPDLGGKNSTQGFGEAVLAALDKA
jgi:3-isopropylmalate dehydrogenase